MTQSDYQSTIETSVSLAITALFNVLVRDLSDGVTGNETAIDIFKQGLANVLAAETIALAQEGNFS